MHLPGLGIVIIGRNEGERLVRCIISVRNHTGNIIYVDSGSSDNSINNASTLGASIVSINLSISMPFTAARARNAGFEQLVKLYPDTGYVQFVDGDCEVKPDWLSNAICFLDSHHNVAAVCGRRRERFPDKTIYNKLCDIEWNTPIGTTKACGGDVLMRVEAFDQVQGFNAALIAGEEPELCVRLRANGWKIWRLDQEMTLHDAAMTRFGQWWKRSKRSGYAFAEGAYIHGAPPERHWIMESRRASIWGLFIPTIIVVFTFLFGVWGLTLLLIYPIQIVRLALRGTRSIKENWLLALFLVLGKFPEAIGSLNFIFNKLVGKTAHLIEYK